MTELPSTSMTDPAELTVDLAYDSTGDGFPLVLVHGFTGSSLDWSDVVEALAADRQVVTFDHRGHGESPNTGDARQLHLRSARRRHDGRSSTISASNASTCSATPWAESSRCGTRSTHPDRVRSLIFMDTAAGTAVDNADMMRAGIELVRTQGTAALYDLLQGFLGEGEVADVQRMP